jgi:hypothetical protein
MWWKKKRNNTKLTDSLITVEQIAEVNLDFVDGQLHISIFIFEIFLAFVRLDSHVQSDFCFGIGWGQNIEFV